MLMDYTSQLSCKGSFGQYVTLYKISNAFPSRITPCNGMIINKMALRESSHHLFVFPVQDIRRN